VQAPNSDAPPHLTGPQTKPLSHRQSVRRTSGAEWCPGRFLRRKVAPAAGWVGGPAARARARAAGGGLRVGAACGGDGPGLLRLLRLVRLIRSVRLLPPGPPPGPAWPSMRAGAPPLTARGGRPIRLLRLLRFAPVAPVGPVDSGWSPPGSPGTPAHHLDLRACARARLPVNCARDGNPPAARPIGPPEAGFFEAQQARRDPAPMDRFCWRHRREPAQWRPFCSTDRRSRRMEGNTGQGALGWPVIPVGGGRWTQFSPRTLHIT
jgi:hypothetical protein